MADDCKSMYHVGRRVVSKGLWAMFVAAALVGCTDIEPEPAPRPRPNTKSMVTTGAEAPKPPSWTIARSGNVISVLRPGKFSMKLADAQFTLQGWTIEESNALRA